MPCGTKPAVAVFVLLAGPGLGGKANRGCRHDQLLPDVSDVVCAHDDLCGLTHFIEEEVDDVALEVVQRIKLLDLAGFLAHVDQACLQSIALGFVLFGQRALEVEVLGLADIFPSCFCLQMLRLHAQLCPEGIPVASVLAELELACAQLGILHLILHIVDEFLGVRNCVLRLLTEVLHVFGRIQSVVQPLLTQRCWVCLLVDLLDHLDYLFRVDLVQKAHRGGTPGKATVLSCPGKALMPGKQEALE